MLRTLLPAFLALAAACSAFDVDGPDQPPPLPAADVLFPGDLARGDGFGSATAFDGVTLFVGAPGANAPGAQPNEVLDDAGAVYVYSSSAGLFTMSARLTAPTPRRGERFGTSVSLAGDVLVVGAPGADHAVDAAGAVYVFQRQGDAFVPIPQP